MNKQLFGNENILKLTPALFIFCLYFPTLTDLYTHRWASIDFHHAYFILPIFIWLIWQKRDLFLNLTAPPSIQENTAGIFILIFGALLYIIGCHSDYLMVSTFSLLPVLSGYICFIFGIKVLTRLWFPLTYLLLMIPLPLGIMDSITIPMRYSVASAAEFILSFLNYPISREGLTLLLNGKQIYMGAPCSGFRSLITLIALGVVYIYISSGSPRTKSILLLSIIPMALLGNLFRVISVCLAMNYFNSRISCRIHDFGGYAIFIFLILTLIALENLCLKMEKKGACP